MITIQTAIAIAENIYQQINKLAQEMNVTVNQLFALSMQEYLQHHSHNQVLENINDLDDLDELEKIMLEKMRHHQRYLQEQ
jgi:molybdopterin-guanine dinucleotide biosynthesis protein A